MLEAAKEAGVGPMAAVAGGIAECVGRGLLEAGHKEIIVENGGDIFLSRSIGLTVSVFAGQSPLSNRLGLKIAADTAAINRTGLYQDPILKTEDRSWAS